MEPPLPNYQEKEALVVLFAKDAAVMKQTS